MPAEKFKMMCLTPGDYQLIAHFLIGISVPFMKTSEASAAKGAMDRAKLVEMDKDMLDDKGK